MSDALPQTDEPLSQEIKQLIDTAKRRAAIAINKELTLLYPSRKSPPDVLIEDAPLLEFLGLCSSPLNKDSETAILHSIERCLLQLGSQFASIGVSKRLEANGQTYDIDLLLFNRVLNRLVAVEFYPQSLPPSYKRSLSQRLQFLAEHEQESHEQPPVGLVLYAGMEEVTVELLALDGDDTWTGTYPSALPSKKLLQARLREAIASTSWRTGSAENL